MLNQSIYTHYHTEPITNRRLPVTVNFVYQKTWFALLWPIKVILKVVDFSTNRKRVDFLLVLSSNLGPILPRFRDSTAFVRQKPLFQYRTPIPTDQNSGCSLWSKSVMLGSTERRKHRLISHEIIFEVFQPMWPRHLNVIDGQTDDDMNWYVRSK